MLADVRVVSAQVALAAGDGARAQRELAEAIALHRAKGNVVSERRTVELRTALGLAPVST